MRRIAIIALLTLLITGLISFVDATPALADHEPGHTATSGEEEEEESETEDDPESKAAQAAREQECPEPTALFPLKLGVPLGNVTEVSGLAEYINEGYRFGVGVVLIVAIVMVVWGGFRYLVGSGVGDVERGKEIIRDAIVGMLIVLAAYAILQTVNPATTNLSPPAISNVGCDPLNLPDSAKKRYGECESNDDCEEGTRCVPTETAFEPISLESLGGAARGVSDVLTEEGGVVQATLAPMNVIVAGTAGYVHNINRTIKLCTDGTEGAPCGSDVNCNDGLKCSSDWRLCISENNNSIGSPCDEDGDCASGECSGDTGDDANRKRCRGEVPRFTISAFRSAGFTIPDRYFCTQNRDCSEPGDQCWGPPNLGVEVCVQVDDPPSGTPCFLVGGGATVPGACSGFRGVEESDMICAVCPPEGDRRWERLERSNDPGQTRIGECKDRDELDELCGGSAS